MNELPFISRRSFLQTATSTCAFAAFHAPLLASVLEPAVPTATQRLASGWEFYRGPLDPRFQVWQSEELNTWSPVIVPHCFNAYDACDPDVPAYRGPGWYRTRLTLANPYPNGRTLLHFEAAGQRAEVYIGDKLAGTHSGGYDEFLIDITTLAQGQTSIPLAVLCDNSRDIERMPSDLSDFTLYGGLYRPVHLVYVPSVSIDLLHTRVQWQPGKPAHLAIHCRLYAPGLNAASLLLRLTVFDPANNPILERTLSRTTWQDSAELATLDIPNPEPWSPASPALYRTELALTVNGSTTTASHRFGIRHFRFEDHGPFFLNGQRLPIRGTQRHEDHAGYAAAMPDDLIVDEMRLMKQMGANFVRLAHYQQSRLVLNQCDELGLLVWEEVPWCRSGVGSPLFQQRGRQQLTAMIEQHCNHPSVILWGLGNEDDWPGELNGTDKAAIRAYMTALRDLAHQLDPTRLTSFRRCDFARDIPDVYSPSIWAGWYSGSYTEYRAALEKARPTVPHLLHVEFGADSHASRHAEDADPVLAHILIGKGTAEKGLDYKLDGGAIRVSRDGEWSETYACDLFDWYLKTLEELPWLTGAVQWIFKDFTTPLRVENPVPRVNQKGPLTRDMAPKEGYFVFQSYWSTEPMLRLYGHDWPVRWGKPGQQRLVRVYSNCPEVELFLNGVSAGIRKRDPQDFPAAGLRWDLAFKPGHNDLHAVAHKDGKQLTDQVQFLYQTEPWSSPHHFQLSLDHSTPESTTVLATLHDANGIRCLDSRAVVSFSLAGDGRLHDNLGTPTGSRVVQLANGRAAISLTHAADVVVGVQSVGVKPAFLPLPKNPLKGTSIKSDLPAIKARRRIQTTTLLALAAISLLPIAKAQQTRPPTPATVDREAAGDSSDQPGPLASDLSPALNATAIHKAMHKVADWQLAHSEPNFNQQWTYAALYDGLLAASNSTQDPKYRSAVQHAAERFDWKLLDTRFPHADDEAIGRAYLELYQAPPAPERIAQTRQVLDRLIAQPIQPSPDPLKKDLWWWCDALFMAPPVLARMSVITGDRKYLDYMDKQWWTTSATLYDPQERLYFRDASYFQKKDANGEKLFWSRGNGWVLAGLAEVLKLMPADYPSRPKYVAQFRAMAERIVGLQQPDGLWRSSLLDPRAYAMPEVSGSAFFTYALAWGIDSGILDRKLYLPHVEKGWQGLLQHIYADGRLGSIQPVGAAPGAFTASSSYVYGVGAFLLAGSELTTLSTAHASRARTATANAKQ